MSYTILKEISINRCGYITQVSRTVRLSSSVVEDQVDRPSVTSGYLRRQIESNQWEKDLIQAVRYPVVVTYKHYYYLCIKTFFICL